MSDIKKTLRFFAKAFQSYERALTAPESSTNDSYNIYYNQTRLMLKIFTDYTANDGYINLLEYVNLDDCPEVFDLFLPLPSIIQRFEMVAEKFPEECAWDLRFNLLTCYLTFVETQNSASGEEIVVVSSKFIELAQALHQELLQELADWNSNLDDILDNDKLKEDGLIQQTDYDLKTGSGVKSNLREEQKSELVEMLDEITPQGFIDTASVCYKFIETVMETIIESRNDPESTINPVQLNYLEDTLGKFLAQINDIISSVKFKDVSTEEVEQALRSIECLRTVSSGDLNSLLNFLESSDVSNIDIQLSNVDIMQVAILSQPHMGPDEQWRLCTALNKTLQQAQNLLSEKRTKIVSAKLKDSENELSPLVFKLCDVLIIRSDNELRRWVIKKSMLQSAAADQDIKVMNILLKNASALLANASAIAQQPCGFREYVTDKLKRNYVYQQSSHRITLLENGTTNDSIADLVQQHPYYSKSW